MTDGAASSAPDTSRRALAFVTMVRGDHEMLARWISHHGALAGTREALHVVAHGSDPRISGLAQGCSQIVLPYDPAGIDPRATYAVRARITLDGRLLFTSDTLHPVITNGAATRVEVPMVRVADRADQRRQQVQRVLARLDGRGQRIADDRQVRRRGIGVE